MVADPAGTSSLSPGDRRVAEAPGRPACVTRGTARLSFVASGNAIATAIALCPFDKCRRLLLSDRIKLLIAFSSRSASCSMKCGSTPASLHAARRLRLSIRSPGALCRPTRNAQERRSPRGNGSYSAARCACSWAVLVGAACTSGVSSRFRSRNSGETGSKLSPLNTRIYACPALGSSRSPSVASCVACTATATEGRRSRADHAQRRAGGPGLIRRRGAMPGEPIFGEIAFGGDEEDRKRCARQRQSSSGVLRAVKVPAKVTAGAACSAGQARRGGATSVWVNG